MRDIPMFTTEFGVASIALKEVPYKGIAYITIQDSLQPEQLLGECIAFCKSAGAEEIYATGHSFLEKYPLHSAVWKMCRLRDGIGETDAALFPVTEKTVDNWRNLYNEKMRNVSHAATLTRADAEAIIKEGVGYYVHRNGDLLGIGIARGETVESVIAAKPGAGMDVMLALCSVLQSERINLEVASDNLPAIKLYEKLGFLKISEISRWYAVVTRKNT